MFRAKPKDAADGTEDGSARERILIAAGELFAEFGFDATPTSRIAERAGVPKGLVHYYFRRKPDLLVALVERLPEEPTDRDGIVVAGDIATSLRRLVAALDARIDSSPLLSHLLWREADTHEAVRNALQARYRRVARQIHAVILAAATEDIPADDVASAAELLALAVSYRHSVARHVGGCTGEETAEPDPTEQIDREIEFLAGALAARAASLAGRR